MTSAAPSLFIQRLRLTDFRNHAALDLALDGRCVAFAGPNGAGKTNLLEAVSLLSPGRGLRRAQPAELARQRPSAAGATAWGVRATLIRAGDTLEIATGSVPESPNSRVVRIDDTPAPQTALGPLAPMVWLTPAQDRLFAGPPGDRRRFLDRLALAAFPEHAAVSGRYERALRDRQRLLDEGPADPAWLDALEAELAASGAAITAVRAETARRLAAAIEARPDGPFPRARLAVEGDLERQAAEGAAPADIESAFRAALRASRPRDAAAGRALAGPQRSDLEVVYAAKGQPAALCSTGEQKALLTGIILAQAAALAASGPAPLVLLDEAAAHLDPDRRAVLAEELLALNVQAFLTGVEPRLFDGFGDAVQRFAVSDGSVTPL